MVGRANGFVCHGQLWLVEQLALSVMDSYGRQNNWFCLSWTVMVGSASEFVCHGQLWLVEQPELSVMDSYGW